MLSEVAEGWKQATLGEVLEVMRNGFSCKQEKSPLEGYAPVSRIETISTGSIDASRVGYVPYEEKLERYKIEKGDILFSHINSVEHIAKVAFAEEAQSFYHAMNLLLLRSDSTKIVPRYLAEVLRWERTRAYFREHCKRAVNQASLNQQNISEYELALPPLNEQKRIAEVLSSVDASIQATQAVIDQAERVKQGLMEELLTGGLGSAAIECGEVPEGWELQRLGDLISLEYGKSLPAKKRTAGEYPVYGSAGIVGTHSECLISSESIVVGRKGTVGAVYKTTKPFFPIDTTYYVVPKKKLNWDWLTSLLKALHLERLNEATGVPGLNRTTAYRCRVVVPPPSEQDAIADALNSVDDFIAKHRATIEQQKRIKQGLMDDLLTGKVRTV